MFTLSCLDIKIQRAHFVFSCRSNKFPELTVRTLKMNRRALASKKKRRVLASYCAGMSQENVFVIVLCLWTTIGTQASKLSSESDQTVRASQEHTNAIHDRSRPSFRLSSVVRFYPKVVGPLPGPICDATLWADSASTIQNVEWNIAS